MFGAAVLAAVLALAGAPAGTTVTCHPDALVAQGGLVGGALGITYRRPPAHIELYGPLVCAALVYAQASPAERLAIAELNPTVNFQAVVGVGLLVALHEATHVGLNSGDECLVEKTALAGLPGLISRYLDAFTVGRALAYAQASDASLPAQYHGC